MKSGSVATVNTTSSTKLLLKTDALAARGLEGIVGEGMDSKGLDVCSSLEQDNTCWLGCCQDGRIDACHDACLDSPILSYCWFVLTAGTQFIVTKQGEEAQTGPAEYLATSAIMSC